MKAYFNVHGHLVVEGEDTTEWLALKTWMADWTKGDSPLWISVKAPGREGFAETDCRQLFRTQPSPAPEPDEAELSPYYALLSDYETLIRLARRCAYDLRHVVGDLPETSYFITDAGMRDRADMWVGLFAKGNPGKDYRQETAMALESRTRQLDSLHAWCKDRGLEPPDERDYAPF